VALHIAGRGSTEERGYVVARLRTRYADGRSHGATPVGDRAAALDSGHTLNRKLIGLCKRLKVLALGRDDSLNVVRGENLSY
jgi:hypothetical protein